LDPRAESLTTKRLRIFARICLAWGVVLLLRLIQLQVIEHDKYLRLAQLQQQREVEIRAPRGNIFDRNGQPLALSVTVDSVHINPQRLPDAAVAAGVLSGVLGLERQSLLERIQRYRKQRRGFMWVKRKITPEEANKLRSLRLDWIDFTAESTRTYPNTERAAHVLGGVGHDGKGNGGIELSMNDILEGSPGLLMTQADVRRNVFDSILERAAIPGSDITLTLDERIQFVAEQELAKAVSASDASTGSLVVMDPRNGDFLAMANYPTYDPNVPPKDQAAFAARQNLALSAPFEPGSVFKVITVAAGLESTRITPNSFFHCGNGRFTLFKRVIHDAHPHGVLSVADILAKSSNIGSIKVALQVGSEKLYEYVRGFGFGQKTGLPLPGESGGILRRPETWHPAAIGSIAMGHEISTTTVQLARACSVVANGGYLVQPRLILSSKKRDGEREKSGVAAPVRVLKPETAMKLRMMMEGVVVRKDGTGKRARVPGYSAAGKTGSAQIYDFAARTYTHRYNGSFMGFAPVTDPKLVVVVTLNGTRSGSQGFGGVVAAPVFSAVAASALRLLDVPKDLPDEVPEGDEESETLESDLAIAGLGDAPDVDEDRTSEEEAAEAEESLEPAVLHVGPKVPDFLGKTKREVLAQAAAARVRIEMAGSGMARDQEPPPGAALEPGSRVRVVFAR
jgi:cell division protein FtsI (penicillin-binding protein 3)